MNQNSQNIVPLTPDGSNIITVDGSLGSVFTYAQAAVSSVIVKNVAPGRTVKLFTTVGATPRALTADAATVQALAFTGSGITAFTQAGANSISVYDITGLTATAALVSCGSSTNA